MRCGLVLAGSWEAELGCVLGCSNSALMSVGAGAVGTGSSCRVPAAATDAAVAAAP